jgi:hypothetical protein
MEVQNQAFKKEIVDQTFDSFVDIQFCEVRSLQCASIFRGLMDARIFV